MINEKAIKGEKWTGYAGPDAGPFKCGNCEFFNRITEGCKQDDMREYSKRPKLASGDVHVDHDGCCIYFDER